MVTTAMTARAPYGPNARARMVATTSFSSPEITLRMSGVARMSAKQVNIAAAPPT